MSFALIRPDDSFELYTDIRELHPNRTGKEFQNAIKQMFPNWKERRFDPKKMCTIHPLHRLVDIKSLCEVYFKDDWKTKDTRMTNPKAYIRHLLKLSPNCPDRIVQGYFKLITNADSCAFLNIDMKTLSDTYDRAYSNT